LKLSSANESRKARAEEETSAEEEERREEEEKEERWGTPEAIEDTLMEGQEGQ
jgi:hypothetical protein